VAPWRNDALSFESTAAVEGCFDPTALGNDPYLKESLMTSRIVVIAAAFVSCVTSEDATYDTQVLADEQAPLPQNFILEVDQLVGGETSRFTVHDAPSNTIIHVARAVGGGIAPGPSPPAIFPEHLDINGPNGVEKFLFTITTDAGGYGFHDLCLPDTIPDYIPVGLQAVHVASRTGSFPIVIVTDPPTQPDAYEPNDDGFSEATLLVGTISAVISPCGDFDWFRFDAVAGQTIVVTALFTHIAGAVDIDTYLYFDAPTDNTTFRSGGQYQVGGYSGDNDEVMTYTAASTGTYYVLVHNYVATTTPGPYTLSYTATP
jgi:hypothetical protein